MNARPSAGAPVRGRRKRQSDSRRPAAWTAGVDARPNDGSADSDAESPFRSVGFTISTTGYALQRRFRELLKPLGLDPRELALLQSLAATEGVTQQAIANRIGVPPSRMSTLVDGLEERGLLERRRSRESRRAHALYLTPEGVELLGRAFAVAVEQEQHLTSRLSGEQREQLLELLTLVGTQVGIPPGVHPGMGHSALADE
jgi:DNA-binding MarR family transcriptional regulator